MMLEPARRAGDSPRAVPGHAARRLTAAPAPEPNPHPTPGSPPDPGPAVTGDVRRTQRQQWLDRRDLERRLHDGPALRISALALRLGLFRHRVPAADRGLLDAVDELQNELHAVLQELRDVAGRLYPPLLDESGLGPALREVAGRMAVPVRVVAPEDRFGAAAEGACYFAVLACLADVAPDGPAVEVTIRRDGDTLVVVVAGVDARHAAAVHDGVGLLGGAVEVADGPHPAATTITARVPCE